MATKATTVRLSKELLKEIDERCQKDGICRNDFIKTAIDNQLELEDEMKEESDSSTPKEKPRYKVIIDADMPKAQVTKVSYDNGKTWIDVKWIIENTDTKSKEPYYDKHENYYYYNHEKGKWVCRIILWNNISLY